MPITTRTQLAPRKKYLIINADDFGLTSGINDGIIEAHQEGVLTSASMLANGEAFVDAVEKIQKFSSLGIGVHLTLVNGSPVSPVEKIPLILQDEQKFSSNYLGFVRKYLKCILSGNWCLFKKQLEIEFTAQIEKIKAHHIKIDHLDSHQHLHLLPGIFEICLDLANRFSIPFIRLADHIIDTSESRIRGKKVKKYLLKLNSLWNNWKKPKMKTFQKVQTVDYLSGVTEAGFLRKNNIEKLVDQIKPGVTELICHPGYEDPQLYQSYPWGYHWQEELRTLKALKISGILQEKEITLVRFADLMI